MTEYCDDHIEAVLLDKRRSKAKKDHVCNICNRPIPKGSLYVREVAIVDGDFYVSKRHEENPEYDCIVD